VNTKGSKAVLARMGLAAAFALGTLLGASAASAGVANTKHNLSTGGNANNVHVTAGTEEICVFCHTPHGSDTTAAVPLWNKQLPGSTYTTYSTLNSSTIDGQVLSVGSVALACLSCHDGTQAMDNIINAPGSGGYQANGGGVDGLGYTWAGGAARVDATGKLATGNIANIGTDLRNDHPIGIQYCGGGPNATNLQAACKDTDFKGPGNGLVTAEINAQRVWWVDSGTTAGSRDKNDMILFTRAFGTDTGPSVECATCHDPHQETNATFLRISNAGSAVCLACHVK